VPVVVATIVDEAAGYAEVAVAELRKAGVAAQADLRNEKINRKVVDHIDQRVPVLAVVGRREAEEGNLVLRRLPGREQETLPLPEAVARLAAEATPPDLKAS
jgi:threonyl-tRNA synthetase